MILIMEGRTSIQIKDKIQMLETISPRLISCPRTWIFFRPENPVSSVFIKILPKSVIGNGMCIPQTVVGGG